MDRPAEAERLLRTRDDLERNSWLQRLMARARLGQGDPGEALIWVDKALERLSAEHFRSEFLELRFDIRTALGDIGAIEDLLKARSVSQKEMETTRIEARISEVEQAQQ
jgi:hypothetical protein